MDRFITKVPIRDSHFGQYYDLSATWEKSPSAIIVAANHYGLQPIRLSLPHQLYVTLAEELAVEHKATDGIWVLPVRDEWVRVR